MNAGFASSSGNDQRGNRIKLTWVVKVRNCGILINSGHVDPTDEYLRALVESLSWSAKTGTSPSLSSPYRLHSGLRSTFDQSWYK